MAPSKDRFNKNQQFPLSDDEKITLKDAIVTAYRNRVGADFMVNQWVYSVFFKRTSKLGIDFAVTNGQRIHVNTFAPAYDGNPASRVHSDAGTPVRARQPVTHSEIRYMYRKYGADHAHIDMYYMDTDSPSRTITRGRNEGKIGRRLMPLLPV